jgi:tetratricopeptide (TPR) repeat protein
MKKEMPIAMLKKIWTDLTTQFGKSTSIQAIKTEKLLEYIRVHEECRFEKGQAVLLVVIGKELKISGLFVLSLDQAGNIVEKSTFVKLDPAASRKKAQEGWQCFMQGNSAEGEPLFLVATELDPQNANAWQGLGWSQWSQGKKDEAKKSFETCLTLDKRNTAAMNGLGQIAQLAGDTERAIGYWTEGAKLDPRATGPMASLAAVYDGKDDYENAIKYYEMWLRAEPNNDHAKTALAKVKEKTVKQ